MTAERRDAGFVLVLVLWLIVLLTMVIAGYALATRTAARIAANAVESARAEALADAGITLAILDLGRLRREADQPRRYPVNGPPTTCRFGRDGTITITVRDEAGKIDINSAGSPLLEALFAGMGEGARSAALADAIFDYRDADNSRRLNGAESDDYRQAGLAWGPRNAPLIDVQELARVIGFDAALVARLRPFITTHSGLSGFDPTYANKDLTTLVRKGLEIRPIAVASFPVLDAAYALPRIFITPSRSTAFTVTSIGKIKSGAIFIRSAVVLVPLNPSSRPTILNYGAADSSAANDVTYLTASIC